MNTEQKAKAYDEALDRAKKELQTCGSTDCDAARQIFRFFPTLRESEDERIRKEIIDFIQWSEDRHFMREDFHQAKRPAVWIAYLEKQKECVADSSKTSVDEDESIRKFLVDYFTSYKIGNVATKLNGVRIDDILNYLEKQKETANSFTDGVIEVRSFQRGLEEGKRLERQKENSKSADSISSDCESNAKCENRWHKVEDSLPDSTREVLCKDAIGNYFIGRYYSKGVWEVSMYDDCDKSNEDNPPVVMWIDIPSEKQKEQKPRWEINNPHTTKWTKEMIDEKFEELVEEYHKQKPVVTHGETYHVDTLGTQQVIAGKMPQKPAEWSEEDENKIESIKGLITMGKFVDTNTIKTIWKLLDSLRPQPKVEWSEEDEKILKGIIGLIDHNQHYDVSNKDMLAWLKSLRPVSKESLQPHWKPSEEQMEALNKAIPVCMGVAGRDEIIPLESLYEQLKKL